MRVIRYFFTFLFLMMALGFALLNAGAVDVNYYLGTSRLPLSLLVILAFGVGCIVGLLITMSWYWRARWEGRKCAKKLALVEKELANLRAMPLKDLS